MSISVGTPSVTNSTDLTKAVKVYYQDGAPADLTERPHPGYALLRKGLWTGGEPWTIVAKKDGTHGKSKTFGTGRTNAGSSGFKPEQWQVTRVRDYVFADIAGETVYATRNDAASFFNVFTEEVDSAFQTMGNVMAAEFYRDGTGVLATIDGTGTTTLTLTNVADIRHFEVGQYIDYHEVGVGLVTDNAGLNKITTVSLENGEVTFATAPTGWSTAASAIGAADGLGYMGDMTYSGGLTQTALAGLEAWNPAATGGSLFGVTQNSEKLCGTRYSAVTNSQTYREAITDFCALHQRANGRFGYIAMHPENWSEFEKELDTKVYSVEGPSESFGFRMLTYMAPWGDIKIFADPDCPYGVARGIDYNNIELRTLHQPGPFILNLDGLDALRKQDTDDIEVQIGYYGNIGCTKTNNFGRLVLPA